MRKLMISVLAGSLTVAGASAQVKAYKPSKPMEGNTVAYALPRSVVRVQVVAERESVRVGPYARFAQKLLGVMAPLADKTSTRFRALRSARLRKPIRPKCMRWTIPTRAR